MTREQGFAKFCATAEGVVLLKANKLAAGDELIDPEILGERPRRPGAGANANDAPRAD